MFGWNSGCAHLPDPFRRFPTKWYIWLFNAKFRIGPVALTWGKILAITFLGQYGYVSIRIDARNAKMEKLSRYLFCSKVTRERLALPKTYIDLSWPPEPYVLELGQFWRRPSQRTIQWLSSVFLRPATHNSLLDNCTFSGKYDISLNKTFDDLWRPRFWPQRNNDRINFGWNCYRLSNAVYCISLSLSVSRIEVGIEISPHPPPPRRGASCREARYGAG